LTAPRSLHHRHVPLYRVVRARWGDPLDATQSQARGGRWNPPSSFPVLHACCSATVARALARERLDQAGVVLDDLQPDAMPQLVEIGWEGRVVDVVSAEGVAAAGLPPDYPRGVGHERTQPLGKSWHKARRAGVVCRSATLGRSAFSAWSGAHETFSEVAIFVDHARRPKLLGRSSDTAWLVP
jgi:RES domain-containing protein